MFSMIHSHGAGLPAALLAGGILLAGCSKGHTEEPSSPEDKTEIRQIAPSVTLKAPEPLSGSMGNVYLLQMDFGFARSEQSGRDWEVAENPIGATCNEYVGGSGETEAYLKFAPAQYYYPDERVSRLQGWYPANGEFGIDEVGGYVDIGFDGQTDVLISDIGQGSTFSKGLDRLYHFYHVLTQLQFEVKAVSAIAASQWGKITAITLTDESDRYTHDLFSGTAKEGNAADPSPDDIGGGRFSGKSEFDVALPAGSVTVTDDAYSPAGIVMIEPRDLSSRNGSLTIYITAEDATGTVRESEIAIDRNSYQESGITTPDLQAGYSYKIRLELMQDDVTFTLVPAEWKTVEQPVDIGKTEPYVRGGDNYIITRNMFGNASGWDVRDDEWAGAQASGNTVPPVMEVAVSDAAGSADWNTAGTVCPSGWHLPTEQELKLIWTYQDRLCKEGHVPLEGNYWSCTEAGNGSYYYVDMDAESYVRQSAASSETGNVRCVRDIANSIDY